MSNSVFLVLHKRSNLIKFDNKKIIEKLNYWGADRVGVFNHENISIACIEQITLPESSQSNNPYLLLEHIIVGDCRLDNRNEIIKTLNIKEEISDVACCLHAYLKWGNNCLKYIKGDFAFIIINKISKKIFSAIDPFGIKSLYYINNSEFIIISSEIKTINYFNNTHNQFCFEYIIKRLTIESLNKDSYNENTLYKNIKRLLPGTQLEFNKNLFIKKYFYINNLSYIYYKKKSDYYDEFKELFYKSIKYRIRGENIGTELSGGIDSSSITAIAKIFSKKIKTFTHIPLKKSNYYDESNISKKLIRDLGIENAFFIDSNPFNIDHVLNQLSKINGTLSESIYPILSYYLYENAKNNNTKILLSGVGGDECVTNHAKLLEREFIYNREFKKFFHLNKEMNITQKYKQFFSLLCQLNLYNTHYILKKSFGLKQNKYFKTSNFIINKATQNKFKLHKRYKLSQFRNRYKTVQEREYNYLFGKSSGYLRSRITSTIETARGFGLEYRFPMLDIDLVKYCLRVPAEHKRNKLGGRMLIRNSLIGVVPEYILKRHEKAGAACPSSDYQLFKKGGILEKTLKVTKLNKELKKLIDPINYKLLENDNRLISSSQCLAGLHLIELNKIIHSQ